MNSPNQMFMRISVDQSTAFKSYATEQALIVNEIYTSFGIDTDTSVYSVKESAEDLLAVRLKFQLSSCQHPSTPTKKIH